MDTETQEQAPIPSRSDTRNADGSNRPRSMARSDSARRLSTLLEVTEPNTSIYTVDADGRSLLSTKRYSGSPESMQHAIKETVYVGEVPEFRQMIRVPPSPSLPPRKGCFKRHWKTWWFSPAVCTAGIFIAMIIFSTATSILSFVDKNENTTMEMTGPGIYSTLLSTIQIQVETAGGDAHTLTLSTSDTASSKVECSAEKCSPTSGSSYSASGSSLTSPTSSPTITSSSPKQIIATLSLAATFSVSRPSPSPEQDIVSMADALTITTGLPQINARDVTSKGSAAKSWVGEQITQVILICGIVYFLVI